MNRRNFIAGTAALLVSPRRSRAQGTRRRVGFLATNVVEPTVQKAWIDGLRNHGWIDGRNLTIEYRYAPSQDRLPAFAAELDARGAHRAIERCRAASHRDRWERGRRKRAGNLWPKTSDHRLGIIRIARPKTPQAFWSDPKIDRDLSAADVERGQSAAGG